MWVNAPSGIKVGFPPLNPREALVRGSVFVVNLLSISMRMGSNDVTLDTCREMPYEFIYIFIPFQLQVLRKVIKTLDTTDGILEVPCVMDGYG